MFWHYLPLLIKSNTVDRAILFITFFNNDELTIMNTALSMIVNRSKINEIYNKNRNRNS